MRKRKTLSRIKLSDSQREKLKEEIAAPGSYRIFSSTNLP